MKKYILQNLLVCFLLFWLSIQLMAQVKPFQSEGNPNSLIQAQNKLQNAKKLTEIANYPKAYDELWDVLSLADSLKASSIKYKAWQQLSMLYSIFENRNTALRCLDSMFLYAQRSGIIQDIKSNIQLHYSAGLTYRMNKKYSLAQEQIQYCEKLCDSIHIDFHKRIYILTEKAHLYTLVGQYEKAQQLLEQISKNLSATHSYNAIIFSMWGDLYRAKGNTQKAIDYFKKSLHAISEQNTRIGLKVDLLGKLADLYHKQGNDSKAFQCMAESKNLGESLFGSRSENNRQLFQIKDNYRIAIAKNERIRKEQELLAYKKQKKSLIREVLLLSLLLIIIGIASTLTIILMKRKHLAEKKLKLAKSNAQLQIKNRELTVTALQLIEKDNLLSEVKQILNESKEDNRDAAIHRIKSTIHVNKAQTWKDFEARFVQVNSQFYKNLSHKHPELSNNELKLCALIKLNFSNKEIARLMAIHPESVSKAKYRLRKKLQLEKEQHLRSYIGRL